MCKTILTAASVRITSDNLLTYVTIPTQSGN